MWWNDYWSMPWMFFGPMIMLVFLIICIAMVFFMMRGAQHRRGGADPIEILKERYARGEIDKAEYEERRAILSSG
jgi:putative membrane protein